MTDAFLDWLAPSKPRQTLTGPKMVSQAYVDASMRNAIREVEYAPEGQRNETLYVQTCKMRPFVKSGLLDELYVVDALTAAGQAAGLNDHEMQATIESAFRGTADASDPEYVLGQEQPPPLVLPPSGGGEIAPGAVLPDGIDVWGDLPPLDAAEWMFDYDDTQVTIWGEGDEILWAEGEALMVAGGMGLGKTTLAGLLVRGLLGLEHSVLDLPIAPAEKPILYLAMDRPRQIRRSFRRQFTEEEQEYLKGKLFIKPGPPIADLAMCPPLLARMAEAVGAGTVFVDSLKDAVVGLSEDAVAAAYNRARQTALAKNIQVCELHHMRKAGKDSTGGIGEVFGSTWLTAGAGSVIMLTGEPGDPVVRFRHVKMPADEVGPWHLNHDSDTGVLTVEKINLLIVVKNGGVDGVTAKQAAEAIYETTKPNPSQCKKAQRALDRLTKKGLLNKVEGHRGGPGGSDPAVWFLASTPKDALTWDGGIEWEQITL